MTLKNAILPGWLRNILIWWKNSPINSHVRPEMEDVPHYRTAMRRAATGQYGNHWLRSAALVKPDGIIWEAPSHALAGLFVVQMWDEHWRDVTQGFVDNRGVFLDREAALKLVLANGQLIRKRYGDTDLYSEEVWWCAEWDSYPRRVTFPDGTTHEEWTEKQPR